MMLPTFDGPLPPAPSLDEAREAPLDRLADRVVESHHRFTRTTLAEVQPLAQKVARVHAGERAPQTVLCLVNELADDLTPHLDREEKILFPYIRSLAGPTAPLPPHFGTIRNPLAVMGRDHDRALELLEELRVATDGYVAPPNACRSWRTLWERLAAIDADLVAHMKVEDEVLFPRALEREALVHDAA